MQVLVVKTVGRLLDRNPDSTWHQLLQPGGILLETPIPALKGCLDCWGGVTGQKTQAAGNLCGQNIGAEETITALSSRTPGPSDKSGQVTVPRSIFCE